jgi:hypothetical protein
MEAKSYFFCPYHFSFKIIRYGILDAINKTVAEFLPNKHPIRAPISVAMFST